MRRHYEDADGDGYAGAFRVSGYEGIAWRIYGWETEPDEDSEWSGLETRTGRLVCVMVGDDRHFTFAPDEVTALARREYCGVCGQVGCHHDGYSDDDETE